MTFYNGIKRISLRHGARAVQILTAANENYVAFLHIVDVHIVHLGDELQINGESNAAVVKMTVGANVIIENEEQN
jgi:hypothetical protein